MFNKEDLQRFIVAQEDDYSVAFRELESGKKRSHWMWYIFPQLSGLGFSSMATHYALKNLQEAEAFLQHPVLGPRLVEITKVLLELQQRDATAIFGSPDDLKLRSSMTLFRQVSKTLPVFQAVLDKFYGGRPDAKTIALLRSAKASKEQ